MKSIYRVSIFIFFTLLLNSCDINYFWEMYNLQSIPLSALDRELIIKQNRFRQDQKTGILNSTNGLFEVENMGAYMLVEDGTAYIGFLGSDDAADFYNDFSAALTTPDFPVGSGGKVHEGFFNLFQKSENDIRTWALDQQDNNGITDFVVLGHSMGGGIAPLCALFLDDILDTDTTTNLYCQVSGSPRSGNPEFASYFDSRIDCTRIVNGSDQFPSLPYKSLGYKHIGDYCHIGPQPNALLASTMGWLSQHFIVCYAESVK